MTILPSGARIDIDPGVSECVISAASGRPTLSAATITRRPGGKPEIVVVSGPGPWTLPLRAGQDAEVAILLYMDDESEIGRVEDRGPLRIAIGSQNIELPRPDDGHGAVVMAEFYVRNGIPRLRVRGDGYKFGIKAMCRKDNLPVERFVNETRRREEMTPPPSDHRRNNDTAPMIGSGSGIIVAPDHVITNAHVVRNSSSQTIHGENDEIMGRVIAIDEAHDLALLRAPGIGGRPIPIRNDRRVFLGEDVITAGYPLRDILGDTLKVTRGAVSGMKGLSGDVGSFQFSAPIGSGSSGGAVMDSSGNLVGVVTSALAHEQMRIRGAISENMNFSVKSSLVVEMLAAHDIDWTNSTEEALSPSEVTRRIRRSVVAISIR